MECACGIHYSDDPTHWEGLLHDNGPKNAMSRYTAVYVSTCPRCATPGIKIFDFPQNISDLLNPDNPNTSAPARSKTHARFSRPYTVPPEQQSLSTVFPHPSKTHTAKP